MDLKSEVGKLSGVTALVIGIVSAVVTAVLAGLLLTLTGCMQATSMTRVSAEALSDTVVGLVDARGNVFCSGVLTQYGVYTAAHCVSGRDAVSVGLRPDYMGGGRWDRVYRCAVLRVDQAHDVALIEAGPSWAPRARLRRSQVTVGEPVVAIGHPFGVAYTQHRGHLSGPPNSASFPPLRFFTVYAGLMPGMSGGPVFDAQGLVIGVISIYVGSPHLGGAVHVDEFPRTHG